MSLLDPDFVQELEDAPQGSGTQTLEFIKKVISGLIYAELQVAGRNITGQLKKGHGEEDHAAEVDLVITSIAPLAAVPPQVNGVISVTTGTVGAVTTLGAQVKTTAAGAFAISIGGVGAVAVQVVPHKGIPTIASVS